MNNNNNIKNHVLAEENTQLKSFLGSSESSRAIR